jgi:hypothetical protein
MNTEVAMEYREIMWAERKVDVYCGEDCDKWEPEWETSAEGDMGDETMKTPIILDPSTFPPGTKVVISIPLCPECTEDCESCECGFDWEAWAENEYS